jgi:hypothetical protein
MAKRNRKENTTIIAHNQEDLASAEAILNSTEEATPVRTGAVVVTENLDSFQTTGKRGGGGGRTSQFPIKEMEVGGKFFVSLDGRKEGTTRTNLFSVAKHAGYKVSMQKGELNGVIGLMVTRTA